MSEKIKPEWKYVSFEIAPVEFTNLKKDTKVEVGGHECKIGDFLGRIEIEDLKPEIFVIPEADMEKMSWLKRACRDQDILNLDIVKDKK